MNINEKLSSIQKELKAPKSQYNSFGKYKFRNCEDILESVKPLLDGATVTLTDDIIMIGTRIYVKATARFMCGEECIFVNAFAREANEQKGMSDSQLTGSASSYARKYALNGLFAIDDTKDDDTTNEHGKGKPEREAPPASEPKKEDTKTTQPVEKQNSAPKRFTREKPKTEETPEKKEETTIPSKWE